MQLIYEHTPSKEISITDVPIDRVYDKAEVAEFIKEIIGEKTPLKGFHHHVSPYDLYHNMYIDEALERARERGFDV